MKARRDDLQQTIALAIEAFENHEIILDDRENGRWRIATRYENGAVCGNMATEIVSLWGGRLYAGGDSPTCIFAYYSGAAEADTAAWHEDKLCWMGRHNDVGYYVAQKASIGMSNEFVHQWDSDVAAHDLQELLDDEDYEWSEEEKEALQEAVGAARRGDHEYSILSGLHSALYDTECLSNIGRIVNPSVVYAWAACRKLCDLLYGIPEDRETRKPR